MQPRMPGQRGWESVEPEGGVHRDLKTWSPPPCEEDFCRGIEEGLENYLTGCSQLWERSD